MYCSLSDICRFTIVSGEILTDFLSDIALFLYFLRYPDTRFRNVPRSLRCYFTSFLLYFRYPNRSRKSVSRLFIDFDNGVEP